MYFGCFIQVSVCSIKIKCIFTTHIKLEKEFVLLSWNNITNLQRISACKHDVKNTTKWLDHCCSFFITKNLKHYLFFKSQLHYLKCSNHELMYLHSNYI